MVAGGFVGRARELARLDGLLGRVGDARRDLPGVAVLLRGRRRVGKSRLVQVFWWNRQENPKIDLVGADRASAAGRILITGSIKWQTAKPFDRHDHAALVRDMASVPGVDPATELIAVTRSGLTPDAPLRQIGPEELMAAWQR
jgi:hypothetical protein